MEFLILRGHTRLIPQGGLSEFPDAILNGKRLDLYNLYKEVCQWSSVLWEILWMSFYVDFVSKFVGFLRWLQGEDFMSAMASTGRDKYFRRWEITHLQIEWLYVIWLMYIPCLCGSFIWFCYFDSGSPLQNF